MARRSEADAVRFARMKPALLVAAVVAPAALVAAAEQSRR
jgi:hypothetical protein